MANTTVIAGGGLCGCALGYMLIKAGMDVLILEAKDVQKKDKLCGGIMSSRARKAFYDIYGCLIEETIDTTIPEGWVWKRGNSEIKARDPYYIVDRRDLDRYCLDRYLEAGGKLLDLSPVTGVDKALKTVTVRDMRKGNEYPIEFNTLIAADGANSLIRRQVTGEKPANVLAIEGITAKRENRIIAGVAPELFGYLWYIPRKDDAVVGCMFPDEDTDFCKTRLKLFCDELGLETPKTRGAFIPSGHDMLLSHNGVYFAGDAAGLADEFGGGGIHYALRSAKKLAKALTGGRDYAEAMAGDTQELTEVSKKARGRYKLLNLMLDCQDPEHSPSLS